MTLSNVSRRISITVWMLIALSIPIQAFSNERVIWTVSELPANTEPGGQANSVAINPADQNEMYVASDSGGLFKSIDGGLVWKHVDKLPVIFTQSVAYVDTNVVMVSARADFKTINGGGVWYSRNGGEDWTQANLPVPNPNQRLSAYEISGMFGIAVVGTSQGVFVTTNGGGLWTGANPFGNGGNNAVYSVLLAASDGVWRIYAGGPAGVRLGTVPLGQWTAPSQDPAGTAGIRHMHAFSSFPFFRWPSHAFVVNGARQLFRTGNNGSTWTQIASAPTGGGFGTCAGSSFIKSAMRHEDGLDFLDLFFGNDCGLHRLAARVNGTQVDFSGTWTHSLIDRFDTRDLAFVDTDPVLLATNGGLHKTTDGGVRWRFAGGGRAGYNALQVNEVKGQFVESTKPGDPGSTDLYFATWDNNIWASTVSATVFPDPLAPGGVHLDVERRIPPAVQSRITFRICRGCRGQAERHLAHPSPWSDAPGANGAPVLIRRDQYVQNVPAGVDLTVDANNPMWQPFARFPDEPRGIPTLGRAGAGDHAIVYQPYRSNFSGPPSEGATRLMRLQFSQGNGVAIYPEMSGFGGLGISPVPDAAYPVYGVDSRNSLHLIAPDLINQRMMTTWNGGESWDEIPGLTSLVTDNGNVRFRTTLTGATLVPLVTAVSFCPHDPNLVLIGTVQGGIFYSSDRGRTWRKIEGSERATYITSFFWETTTSVFISTYGRGLWRLGNRRIVVADTFDLYCNTCDVVSNDGAPSPPPFHSSVLAFEGRLLGVRTDKGKLREVFVTRGSSVLFTGDPKDPQDDIAITESDGRDTYEPLPKPPDGWIATGVVFTNDDTLTGTAFAKSEMSLLPPESEEVLKGSTQSPSQGRPYLRLQSAAFTGITSVAPREAFDLSATDFAAGASYEVLIDGTAIKSTVTADGRGSFTTRISAPPDSGYHNVEVRLAGGDQVIDGSTFLVSRPN